MNAGTERWRAGTRASNSSGFFVGLGARHFGFVDFFAHLAVPVTRHIDSVSFDTQIQPSKFTCIWKPIRTPDWAVIYDS